MQQSKDAVRITRIKGVEEGPTIRTTGHPRSTALGQAPPPFEPLDLQTLPPLRQHDNSDNREINKPSSWHLDIWARTSFVVNVAMSRG